jgi:pyridine nucleotide-disulfide oxidoreductase family protein
MVPCRKQIVLLGGGHAHVEVVRQSRSFGDRATVTLVSPSRWAPYSGMLPGFIAGQYEFADFHIDLDSLCRQVGVIFQQGEAVAIDPATRQVTFSDGSMLNYDLLSLDIGATPSLPAGVRGGISVKPISSFAERLGALDRLLQESERPLHLAVVGQGVAGVEVAFALKARSERKALGSRSAQATLDISLVGRDKEPIPERSTQARRLVETSMVQAGIRSLTGFDVIALQDGALIARDGRRLAVDDVIWATSSGAPAWLQKTGLALDQNGFVRVDPQLRSISHHDVFAAGDVAALTDPRPKAGVFAVRAGPILAENLRCTLAGIGLRKFNPQQAWLALISLGDRRAIADKWGIAVSGRWVAAWKHWIDSRFVRRYVDHVG